MLKRLMDITGAAAGLLVLSPLFLAVAVATRLTSPGPVFYRQERLARGEGRFRIFKFRTMVDGAERHGARITRAGDARITPLGAFLRRHKLDELPQLLNVLAGDMSLVGPRPEVPEFAVHYPDEFAQVLTVRPGMTDRATQLFRNEEELLARVADPRTFYVERILPRKLALSRVDLERGSLRRDLRIILDTVLDRGESLDLDAVAGAPAAARPARFGGWRPAFPALAERKAASGLG